MTGTRLQNKTANPAEISGNGELRKFPLKCAGPSEKNRRNTMVTPVSLYQSLKLNLRFPLIGSSAYFSDG